MNNVDRLSAALAEFKSDAPDQGIVELIVSVFNKVDGHKDMVMPGFFTKSLESRRNHDGTPKMKGTWSHDWTRIIGKTLDAKELAPGDSMLPEDIRHLGGLYVKGQCNLETEDGRDAFSNLKGGYVDEISFGYKATTVDMDYKTGIRKLIEGDVFEWSPCLVGAMPQSRVLGTKSELEDGDPEDPEPAADPEKPAAKPNTEVKQLPWGYESLEDSFEDRVEDVVEACQSVMDPPWGGGCMIFSVGTYENYAYICVMSYGMHDETSYWRVEYTLDEMGDPVIGNSARVQPAFTPVGEKGMTYLEEVGRVMIGASRLEQRSRSLAELRAKDGRALSGANVERLKTLRDRLTQTVSGLDEMLTKAGPKPEMVDATAEVVGAQLALLRSYGVPV